MFLKTKLSYIFNFLTEKPSEIGLVTDLDKTGCEADASGGGSGSGATCASPRESVYLPTPMRVSLGRRQDISPYATFRVPSSAVGSEGSSEGTIPIDQPQNQLSERVSIALFKLVGFDFRSRLLFYFTKNIFKRQY